MFFQIIIAVLLGVCFGIFTGLIPGIHINLVALIVLSLSAVLLDYVSITSIVAFIIAMAVTHTFLDFIPSIFLGAPDSDTALSILPGHRLLLEGKAFDAVKLTVIGSLLGLIASIILVPALIPTVAFIYPYLKEYIGYILIAIMAFMILRDKKRLWALIMFLMSGILGIIVLSMPNLGNPLFSMLSGLFGVSMLVVSLADKVNIPPQTIKETLKIEKRTIVSSVSAGAFAGMLTSFFPGLGPAQGAIIASQLVRKMTDFGFMIIVGGINTVNMVLSLVTLYTIEKARNGAVLVIAQIAEVIDFNLLVILLSAALIAGGIATFLALNITKIFSRLIQKVNYQILVLSIIFLITALTIYFSGILGLLVLFVSTCIGIIPAKVGVGRNHQMGCLILPVILYFVL